MSELRFLLDTNIVSVPSLPRPNHAVVAQLEAHSAVSALAAPVWHELVYGCSRLPKGRRRTGYERFVYDVVGKTFQILPYDDAAAAWHAAERARLDAIGHVTAFIDGQIAAIAFTNGLTLATANVRHFKGFRGLVVEDWTKMKRGGSSA